MAGRGSHGHWLPGESPNPGGKGIQYTEMQVLARSFTKEAIETAVQIMRTSDAGPVRLAAANMILDRAWGRPAQAVQLSQEPPQQRAELQHYTTEELEELQRIQMRAAERVAQSGQLLAPGN